MKILNKILTMAFPLLLTVSCQQSFLEVEPMGAFSDAILANENGVNKLLIGAYACVNNGAARGGGAQASDAYIFGSDENRIGTIYGVSTYDAFLWNPTDSYIQDKWIYQYAAIGRANDVLRLLPDVKDATPETLLQIESEARFLRAVFYLRLVFYFRNVPWVDEHTSYSERNYLVGNTEDILPKVEADFGYAATHLSETKSELGRANKWAAKCFLAKTYLFQHKYAEAKVLLDDIITNGKTVNGLKYKLLAKYNDNFVGRGKHGSEAVFVMQNSVYDGQPYDNRGNPTDKYGGTYNSPANAGGAGWMQPTFDLIDAFQTDEVTGLPLLETYFETPIPSDNGLSSSDPFTPYAGSLDPRLDWSVGRRGIPYRDWGVHPGEAWIRDQRNSGPYCAIKNTAEQAYKDTDQGRYGGTNNPYNIIRFADVLLWAAECEIEVGSLAKAEEYVNMVRTRAANPDGWVKTYVDSSNPLLGFTDTPAANYKVGLYNGHFESGGKLFARSAVFFERRLEFAMEHHRFFDLVRYAGVDSNFDLANWFNSFMKREGARISNPLNEYKNGRFEVGKHEILPIPQAEIDLSHLEGKSVLVQNPGY